MKSIFTSLAIATVGAVILVLFKWVLTGNHLSLAEGTSAERADSSAQSENLSAIVSTPGRGEAVLKVVDPLARGALERAIEDVDEAESSYASIERELEFLEAEMGVLDPDADELLTQTFLIQAEPLLTRLIAAEAAVQQAKRVERAARAAVAGG
ncbi:MAG: hypothetical protein ACFHXK_02100 [bacterium]